MSSVSVAVVGRDRTLMTIECIKSIMQHLKGSSISIVVGSDRSQPGHVKAVKRFLETLNIQHKILECFSFGGMLNSCCDEAFKTSDYVFLVENDMILHRDMHVGQFIDLLSSTNAGNVQFRYFSPAANNCNVKIFEFKGYNYMLALPGDDLAKTFPVSFGQNLMKRQFYMQVGKFLDNEPDTDKVERQFVKNYCSQLASKNPLVNVLCLNDAHQMMNDEHGYFYHIGIKCQHRAGVLWNKNIIPCQYHYLSDEMLDSSFRRSFMQEMNNDN